VASSSLDNVPSTIHSGSAGSGGETFSVTLADWTVRVMPSCDEAGFWFRLGAMANQLLRCDVDRMVFENFEVQMGERKDRLGRGGHVVVIVEQ
jgi:hypothetical protein